MDFFCDITRYAYLHNALFACLLAGIACGIVGTYVVCRRTVFLAGGITHASFGGLGLAFYLGQNPILGAMVFAVLSALGIEWASARGRIREDSAIGIIWSVGMALGVLFMSLRPGYTSGDLAACLFGNIVTVTDAVLRAPDSVISVSDGRNIRFEHVRFDTPDGAVRLKTDGPLTENIRFADCTPEVR